MPVKGRCCRGCGKGEVVGRAGRGGQARGGELERPGDGVGEGAGVRFLEGGMWRDTANSSWVESI